MTKSVNTALMLEKLGKTLIQELVSEATCPKCQGTLIGLKMTSVMECHDCHKVFQRMSDQDETYYLELIRVH